MLGNRCLQLLRAGGKTPGSSPCWTRPLGHHQENRTWRLREAEAVRGHQLAGWPGSKDSLLFTEESILNKSVDGHSQQSLNPALHVMSPCALRELVCVCIHSSISVTPDSGRDFRIKRCVRGAARAREIGLVSAYEKLCGWENVCPGQGENVRQGRGRAL